MKVSSNNKAKDNNGFSIHEGKLQITDKLIVASIIIFTLLLFEKVLKFEFINWDDTDYVSNNPLIRNVSWKGVIDIFTTPVIGMYNPLTFIVYLIEYSLFGLDPKIFHFFNLLFHLGAIFLSYKVSLRLSGRYEAAAVVALLFAIHPMHICVVTWVSQTKTSLMCIFYFLAVLSYLTYVTNGNKRKTLFITLFYFIIANLFKPEAVTFTPMLFLIDFYIRRKLTKQTFIEKIPFIFISLCFGILTILTHFAVKDDLFSVNFNYTIIHKLLLANYSITFYINKFLLPMRLLAIYPYPEVKEYLPFKYYLSILVIPSLLFIVYKAGSIRREIIFGLLFFLIAISLFIKLVPSGYFRASNQYSYVSYFGLNFAIGSAFCFIIDLKNNKYRLVRKVILWCFSIYVLFLIYRVSIRIEVWKNSISVYNDLIKKKPNFFIPYKNRGNVKLEHGDLVGAFEDYKMSYSLNPKDVTILSNMGYVKLQQGKFEEALKYFNQAIWLDSNNASYYNNRAVLLYQMSQTSKAIDDWKKAASMGNQQAIESLQEINQN